MNVILFDINMGKKLISCIPYDFCVSNTLPGPNKCCHFRRGKLLGCIKHRRQQLRRWLEDIIKTCKGSANPSTLWKRCGQQKSMNGDHLITW